MVNKVIAERPRYNMPGKLAEPPAENMFRRSRESRINSRIPPIQPNEDQHRG
jgi:hypothetical protein